MTTLNNKTPLLPRRLAALLYDTCLVLPIIMAVVAAFMGVRTALIGAGVPALGEGLLHPQLVQIIALLVVTLFFSWFWLRSGQTLGMQAWRIKLVSYQGDVVTPGQALRRCFGAVFSALCLGLGYWWCLFDGRGRYWHDYLSGTELVLLPKEPKSPPKKESKAQKKRPR